MTEIISTFIADKQALSDQIQSLYNNIAVNDVILIKYGSPMTYDGQLFYRIKVSLVSPITSSDLYHDISIQGKITCFAVKPSSGYTDSNIDLEDIYNTLRSDCLQNNNKYISYFREYTGKIENVLQNNTLNKIDNVVSIITENEIAKGELWPNLRPYLAQMGALKLFMQ